MKQRARAQIATIKRTAIKQHQARAGRVGQVKAFIEGGGGDDDEEATIELTKGDRDDEDADIVAAGSSSLQQTKARQDELLRDLLICLVRKYRVEEAKRSPAAKLRMWNDLSREYHRLSGLYDNYLAMKYPN